MANYKYENGSYYRQSSNGSWFKVLRDNDGYLTWTLPDGRKVKDDQFRVPISMLVQNSKIGPMYTVGTGANGSLGHYFSFLDAANAYTKAKESGAFSDPSENILNDLVFDTATGKGAISLTTRGVKAASQMVPLAARATWNAGKRLVTKGITKEAAKEGVKKGLKTGVKLVAREAPKMAIAGVTGYGVNKGSEALTGKSWGENVAQGLTEHYGFRVSPIVGEFTNPGYFYGYNAINGAKLAVMNLNYSIPFLTNNKTLREGFGKVLDRFGLGSGYLNIRYRGGIRDYLGNVLSKYSTIVPKPKLIFTGNLLELARKRVLDNLEKYGIRDSDYVSWTTFSDDPNLILLSKSIGFEIPSYNKGLYSSPQVTITMPAKTYLEHVSPIPGVEASFRPSSATIFHQNSGYVEDIQKLYPEFADAHEFSHAIDWVLHNKTTTIPRTGGVDIRLNTLSIKDMYKKFISDPKADLSNLSGKVDVKIPGLNYNRLKLNIVTQEYHHNPTELKARYELIKNWLGIADERPLTLTEWNLAKRYYTSSIGDNNMQEFFKLVENPEEFINWASRRYYTNYSGTVLGVNITELPRRATPTYLGSYYPYKVSHEDELPGFLDMILELAGGKAPISLTSGLTSYARPKPSRTFTSSERPHRLNSGIKTVFRWKDPKAITAGDLAYGLAHNLPGWNRQTYKEILKDTGNYSFDYEEAARSLMYDVKAQLYKKLAAEKGGSLTATEFEEALWDLKKKDFLSAFQRAHDGMYRRDIPLTFDIENLTTEDINRIINLLTQYKNGGKFHKKGT